MDADRAALVALLRTRPDNRTWRKLTDQVIHAGSATTVWRTYHPVGLIPSSTDVAPLAGLIQAVEDCQAGKFGTVPPNALVPHMSGR